MPSEIRYKRGDTEPALEQTLTRNGEPVDLSSADSVRLVADDRNRTIVLDIAAEIVDDAGEVRVEWAAGDLDLPPAEYAAEWVIEFGDRTLTLPPSGFIQFVIEATAIRSTS